ncbi:GH32 C-terminal domain-containing protein [Enorma phocaeensis]|uniref:GH32 C-terminal domain-containing protein n=1 Tax=Enorma phocaeensis TaxID=1871019 RepID=A0ABT7VA24_9ACTN|nr:GH32 C-terminal domain-containing protein [Enorma phocaeensis]MDM8275361.1 GH32 C-terminal domain-containing protein [Enorma phocaeensis]
MQHAVGPDADDADDTARALRVPVDASAVEVYASGGRDVLSTRWFPVAEELSVALHGSCAAGHVWAMGDGMAGTY